MTSNIQIIVLYFAQVREATKVKKETLEISKNSSVTDLLSLIRTRYPKLRNVSDFNTSVNYKLVNSDAILRDKDEVALLPPVSGG
ncbi:MAG: MoaD/ThiS family protein [Candidatus Nitrosocosmicus sp.]|jgi:molybdopterin converting factor subunit 1|nr:molybdopterin synthase sulfur carrier subunit [Candidatus Nitrosocosmicus sp.]GKS61277.1 molybdopterin synthase sulfur carrier subunit [Candidatus Nitrosocosmicus sp.]